MLFFFISEHRGEKNREILSKKCWNNFVCIDRTINSILGSKGINLFVATAGHVFVVLRGDLRLCCFAEIEFPVFNFHFTAAWLVTRVV